MSRKLITFSRILRTGIVNFFRNAWLSVAAIAVMIITLTIVLFSVITNATFSNTVAQITSKIDISVYLNDSAPQAQVNQLITNLKALPNVSSVTYLTKDQALQQYEQQNVGNTQLLDAINETNNPIPATIIVKPNDLNKIQNIEDSINQSQYKALIGQVSYNGDRKVAIDRIAHATDLLKRAGVAAVIVFAVISVLIIFNTIQMAIFNRRDELTIMRLLGASTWYIRGPFVVEATTYGIIAAFISVLLIHTLFVASSSALQATSLGLLDINYAATYFHMRFWMLLTMQVSVGILIGAVSSVVATRRYLKFKTSK